MSTGIKSNSQAEFKLIKATEASTSTTSLAQEPIDTYKTRNFLYHSNKNIKRWYSKTTT